MMSLSAREQQALDSIEGGLAGSDPGLAALLGTFARLTSGEDMPAREKIRPAGRRDTRDARRSRRHPRRDRACRLYQRPGFQRAALLLWLPITAVIAIALLAAGTAISHGGSRAACTQSWAAVCTAPAPAHPSRPAADKTTADPAPRAAR